PLAPTHADGAADRGEGLGQVLDPPLAAFALQEADDLLLRRLEPSPSLTLAHVGGEPADDPFVLPAGDTARRPAEEVGCRRSRDQEKGAAHGVEPPQCPAFPEQVVEPAGGE